MNRDIIASIGSTSLQITKEEIERLQQDVEIFKERVSLLIAQCDALAAQLDNEKREEKDV